MADPVTAFSVVLAVAAALVVGCGCGAGVLYAFQRYEFIGAVSAPHIVETLRRSAPTTMYTELTSTTRTTTTRDDSSFAGAVRTPYGYRTESSDDMSALHVPTSESFDNF